MVKKEGSGWHRESRRHAKAARKVRGRSRIRGTTSTASQASGLSDLRSKLSELAGHFGFSGEDLSGIMSTAPGFLRDLLEAVKKGGVKAFERGEDWWGNPYIKFTKNDGEVVELKKTQTWQGTKIEYKKR